LSRSAGRCESLESRCLAELLLLEGERGRDLYGQRMTFLETSYEPAAVSSCLCKECWVSRKVFLSVLELADQADHYPYRATIRRR
jgi:hypothetical protein